jgi:hypothetical protein
MSATEHHRDRATKLRRITRACDYCHQRSIRCAGSSTSARCHNCTAFNQPCTYNREVKARGVKHKQRVPASNSASATPQFPQDIEQNNGRSCLAACHHERCLDQRVLMLFVNADSISPQPWKCPYVASQAVVMDLVEIYFEIVYPIFPLFHRPTYIRKVRSKCGLCIAYTNRGIDISR